MPQCVSIDHSELALVISRNLQGGLIAVNHSLGSRKAIELELQDLAPALAARKQVTVGESLHKIGRTEEPILSLLSNLHRIRR